MKMKRLIATALAAAMIFGLVSVGLAASFPDVEEYDFAQEVLRLADLGIIDGYDDGTFKPENLVKRSEFAKMIVCMLGLKNAAELMHGEPVPFSDVDAGHWAAGYINVAEMKGIVGGYPDGTFKPDGNITHAEALKMVLAAMGYAEDGFLVVRWPVTWIIQATELELDKGLEVLANLPISRGEVAKLFDNSLIKKHVYVKEGEFVARDPEVTFMSKLKVASVEGKVVDSPELWDNTSDKVKIVWTEKVDGKDEYKEKSFSIEDYEGLLGHNVKVWHKGNAVLGVEDLSTEKALTANEYAKIKKPSEKFVNFTKAETDEDGVVYYQDKEFDVEAADEIVVVYHGTTPIAVKAIKYRTGTVLETYKYGTRLDIYLEGIGRLDLYKYGVEYMGSVDEFDDIEEGDVVHYIHDSRKDIKRAVIIVVRDVYKGTLTEITYAGKLKVDGKLFDVANKSLLGDAGEYVGGAVTLYLNKDGKVFRIDGTEASEARDFYGVIQGTSSKWDAKDRQIKYYANILTVDGEIEHEYEYNGEEDVVGKAVKGNLDSVLKVETSVLKEVYGEFLVVDKVEVDKITGTVTLITTDTGLPKANYDFSPDTTLWLEGKAGSYQIRPRPFRHDKVMLYYVDGDGDRDVVVGIVK